jgi:hypothetical protein
MKTTLLRAIIAVAPAMAFQTVAHAQTVTMDQALRLQATINESKQNVEFLIDQAGGSDFVGPEVPENDPVALNRLLTSSSSLNTASNFVNALVTTLATTPTDFPTIQLQFVHACTFSAVAKSQVAMARLAALQPPPGTLGAFSAVFGTVIVALDSLRAPSPVGVGCP